MLKSKEIIRNYKRIGVGRTADNNLTLYVIIEDNRWRLEKVSLISTKMFYARNDAPLMINKYVTI